MEFNRRGAFSPEYIVPLADGAGFGLDLIDGYPAHRMGKIRNDGFVDQTFTLDPNFRRSPLEDSATSWR